MTVFNDCFQAADRAFALVEAVDAPRLYRAASTSDHTPQL